MELTLARKEEQILEKDLILEQVDRLAERTNVKAMNGKQDTLALAKKVKYFSPLNLNQRNKVFQIIDLQYL